VAGAERGFEKSRLIPSVLSEGRTSSPDFFRTIIVGFREGCSSSTVEEEVIEETEPRVRWWWKGKALTAFANSVASEARGVRSFSGRDAGEVTDLVRSMFNPSSCDDPPGLVAPFESAFAGVRANSLTRLGCRGKADGEVGDVPPPSPPPELQRYDLPEEELDACEGSSGEAG